MIDFKDVTTYSQGTKERIPTTFTGKCGSMTITVTCGHRDYAPEWVMHCYALSIDTRLLYKATNLEEAKEVAFTIASNRIRQISEDLEAFNC